MESLSQFVKGVASYFGLLHINFYVFMLVNLSKVDVREWCKSPRNVYIGRRTELLEGSKWANPFRISSSNSREKVVKLYELYIRNNRVLLGDIHELKGKNLGCWCRPRLCHGNVLEKLISDFLENTIIFKMFNTQCPSCW